MRGKQLVRWQRGAGEFGLESEAWQQRVDELGARDLKVFGCALQLQAEEVGWQAEIADCVLVLISLSASDTYLASPTR